MHESNIYNIYVIGLADKASSGSIAFDVMGPAPCTAHIKVPGINIVLKSMHLWIFYMIIIICDGRSKFFMQTIADNELIRIIFYKTLKHVCL